MPCLWFGVNWGRAAHSAARLRPARSTVPSGRTTAAVACPRRSQRCRSVPGRAGTRRPPRRATSARWSGDAAAVVTTAKRPAATSSNRRPSSSTAFGHSRPAERAAQPGPDHPLAVAKGGRFAAQDEPGDTRQEAQSRRDQAAQQVAQLPALGHGHADERGQPDERAGVRFALSLVGVQHPLREAAVEHPGQLPGKVRRVPHAGAHPLADERRGEVGGVAEQEHPASPATGRPAGPGRCTRPPAPAAAGRPGRHRSTGRSAGAARPGRGSPPRSPRAAAGTPIDSGSAPTRM